MLKLSKPEAQGQESRFKTRPQQLGPSENFLGVNPSYRFRLTHGQKQSP